MTVAVSSIKLKESRNLTLTCGKKVRIYPELYLCNEDQLEMFDFKFKIIKRKSAFKNKKEQDHYIIDNFTPGSSVYKLTGKYSGIHLETEKTEFIGILLPNMTIETNISKINRMTELYAEKLKKQNPDKDKSLLKTSLSKIKSARTFANIERQAMLAL